MLPACPYTIALDPWPIVEAVSAAFMVLFTWHLLRVSRDQKRISDQQRTLMDRQVSLNFELERGRLYCTSVRIVNGRLFVAFENTGRSQLETERLEFKILEDRRVPTFDAGLDSYPSKSEFRIILHAGKEHTDFYKNNVFHEFDDRSFDQPLFVAFRAFYTTLGERRTYSWGWVFTPELSVKHQYIGGDRFVGRGYERDEPCPAASSDAKLMSS